MNPRHPQIAARAEYRCEYCHAPEVAFNGVFEVEHIVPAARDGGSVMSNLALACRACNSHKSTRVSGSDSESEAVVRIFHPRQDGWEQHFSIDTETGTIRGLTSIGRATIACLNMNSTAQLTARRYWMRLGLFP